MVAPRTPAEPRPDAARFASAIWRIARELAASTSTEPDPWRLVRHVARAEHVVELLAAVDASASSRAGASPRG